MRIIKNNFVKDENEYPKEMTCEHCGSVFEYDENDIVIREYGCAFITCPCCNKNILSDEDSKDIDLTIDNLEYPIHFANNSILVNNETILRHIKDGVKYLKENGDEDYWYTEFSGAFVFIEKQEDDEEYYIIVAKKHQDTYIKM